LTMPQPQPRSGDAAGSSNTPSLRLLCSLAGMLLWHVIVLLADDKPMWWKT